MKTFRIWAKKTMTWDADELIEAENKEAALDKFRQDCIDGSIELNWFDDDDSIDIVGVEECEQ